MCDFERGPGDSRTGRLPRGCVALCAGLVVLVSPGLLRAARPVRVGRDAGTGAGLIAPHSAPAKPPETREQEKERGARDDGAPQDPASPSATPEDYRDEEVRQRYFAMKEKALPSLFAALSDTDARSPAYRTLKALILELVRRAAGFETDERTMAVALSLIHQDAQIEELRHLALELMTELGTDKTLQYLSYRLRDADLAPTVVDALAVSPNPFAGDLLLRSLQQDRLGLEKAYIRALGVRRHVPAVDAIAARLKADDEDLVVTAIQALGRMPAVAAVEALAPLAEDRESRVGLSALYALRSVCRYLDRSGHRAEAIRAYQRIQELVKNHDGQTIAVAGIAEIGGESEARLLLGMMPELPESVIGSAAIAAVNIGSRGDLRLDPDGFRDLYRACLARLPADAPNVPLLRSRLRALGESTPIDEVDGTIRRWWIVGAWGADEIEDWRTPRAPERGVDLFARYPFRGRIGEWVSRISDEPDGRYELDRLLSPGDRAVAYAYTVVEVAEATDAELRTASDDGLAVWLNGEAIFTHYEERRYVPETDRIPIHLNKGENELLVKVCESTGHWYFSVRLLDRQGAPLPFRLP